MFQQRDSPAKGMTVLEGIDYSLYCHQPQNYYEYVYDRPGICAVFPLDVQRIRERRYQKEDGQEAGKIKYGSKNVAEI